MTNTTNKVPTIFWIISGVALLWNAMGAYVYIGQVMMTPETLSQMSEARQALFNATPSWVTGAFAIAVWAGVLGCILLLLRKKLAIPVLIASLVGSLAQNAFFLTQSGIISEFGVMEGVLAPLLVLIVGIFLIWYARSSAAKGWLS